MIVCLCFGVNHQAIEDLRQQGCETLKQLQRECKAGSSCGACIPDLKEAINQSQTKSCHSSS